MLKKRNVKLFFMPNVICFAGILLALVYIFAARTMLPTWHQGSVDLAWVNSPKEMPGANREDAILVAITRDGRVFLTTERGSEQVIPPQLPPRIRRELVRTGGERKVYISADARTKTGTVNEVLDAVRGAGIENIAFIVGKRETILSPPNL